MSTVRSRIQKGRSFQKKICDKFREAFCLDEDDARCPIGCETGVDLKLSKKAKALVGLSIEMKNQKSVSIWAALEQAKANTDEGTVPALIFHRSVSGNKDNWICVPVDHYLKLRRENLELKGELPNE